MTVSSGKEIEYYAYIPDDLSFGSRDSVPLLMWFHGGGGEAEAMVSWTSGRWWPRRTALWWSPSTSTAATTLP